MSLSPGQLHPKFVTDPHDNRTSVLLPLAEYETLLEELKDLRDALEAQGDPSIPWDTHEQDLGLNLESSVDRSNLKVCC